jgi:hypothetical protein
MSVVSGKTLMTEMRLNMHASAVDWQALREAQMKERE